MGRSLLHIVGLSCLWKIGLVFFLRLSSVWSFARGAKLGLVFLLMDRPGNWFGRVLFTVPPPEVRKTNRK